MTPDDQTVLENLIKTLENNVADVISLQHKRPSPFLRMAIAKLSSALEALREAEVEE